MSRATCTHSRCDRPRRYSGLCASHYWRKQNGKDMDAPFRPYRFKNGTERPCAVSGCKNGTRKQGGLLCATHARLKAAGEPNWQRRIRRHRPISESADIMVRVPLTTAAKLKARASARGLTLAEVARGILEVNA
jgi:hypothetical protein